MDKNDLAVGIANIVTEGEEPTKELLALVNVDALNQLYDWLDEHLVERNNETEEDDVANGEDDMNESLDDDDE